MVGSYIPAFDRQYKLSTPFLYKTKFVRYQPLTLVLAVALIGLSIAFLRDQGYHLDIQNLSIAGTLLAFALFSVYAYFFDMAQFILFEDNQITIKRRLRTSVYPSSELSFPGLHTAIDFSLHGATPYVEIELQIGGNKYTITNTQTNIPLTVIHQFLVETYAKDLVRFLDSEEREIIEGL